MANDILVIAEQINGKVADITFEMLGKAREIADLKNIHVILLLLGKTDDTLKGNFGTADSLIQVVDEQFDNYNPEAFQQASTIIAREAMPLFTLIGSTSIGLDIAGPLSAKLGFPLVANCIELTSNPTGLTVTSQLYGGKMMVKVEIDDTPTVLSILPGVFRADKGKNSRTIPIKEVSLAEKLGQVRTKFERMVQPDSKDIDITKMPVLVSVGRGIQNKDNLALAEELAGLLGGAVSASRPVVDQGWLPMTRQVGRSGMTTKPKVYLALGISGAPEHVEGMKNAETIIAVNTDSNAPIFNIAHYGVVGDLLDVIPLLSEEIKKHTS